MSVRKAQGRVGTKGYASMNTHSQSDIDVKNNVQRRLKVEQIMTALEMEEVPEMP